MKKLYQILIILTFLIALFFLCKWVNSIIPRYEWKERIEILEVGDEINFKENSEIFCSNTISVYKYLRKAKYRFVYNNGNIGVCYIKEKIRIK